MLPLSYFKKLWPVTYISKNMSWFMFRRRFMVKFHVFLKCIQYMNNMILWYSRDFEPIFPTVPEKSQVLVSARRWGGGIFHLHQNLRPLRPWWSAVTLDADAGNDHSTEVTASKAFFLSSKKNPTHLTLKNLQKRMVEIIFFKPWYSYSDYICVYIELNSFAPLLIHTLQK